MKIREFLTEYFYDNYQKYNYEKFFLINKLPKKHHLLADDIKCQSWNLAGLLGAIGKIQGTYDNGYTELKFKNNFKRKPNNFYIYNKNYFYNITNHRFNEFIFFNYMLEHVCPISHDENHFIEQRNSKFIIHSYMINF